MIALFVDGPLRGTTREYRYEEPTVRTMEMLPIPVGIDFANLTASYPAAREVIYERFNIDIEGRRLFRVKT